MKVITAGGAQIDLGTVEAAPTISIIDYSRRETDDFGVTTVVKRGFARRLSVRLALPFDQVDAVQRQLADLRATPAQWVADDRFAWLNFEGFYKDFDLDLAVPPLSYCTLNVEGLAETEAGADAGGDPAPGSTSSLRLLQPIDIVEGVLVSSTVPETDYALWLPTSTYAAGARVVAGHRVFESAADGNKGNDPVALGGQWIDVGPTNRWAMFDQALGTVTAAPNSIAVTLSGSGANALALLDVTAASVRVQTAGYDQMQPAGSGSVIFDDLPGSASQITVTITGSGQVSAGTLLLGRIVALGITEASPTAGILDYSRKEVDNFGEVTVVPRAWAKRMSARALIRTDAVDQVANRIASVRALPCLWIGDDGLDSLTVYGFFKEFSIEVGENVSTLSLSIEGLSEAAKPGTLAPNWTDIVDNDPDGRPKPEDGATVGAPAGTMVGDRPAETVNEQLDAAAEGIEGLVETYGTTTAAAASAAASAASASAAAAAQTLASDARDQAQSALADAQSAQTAAESAQGQAENLAAQAASSQAAAAANALAADAAKEASEAARAHAQEHATNASGSAASAAGSAFNASTSASNAANSASAASASSVFASAAANTMGLQPNYDFAEGQAYFTQAYNDRSPLTKFTLQSAYQGRTNVLVTAAGQDLNLGGKIRQIAPGATYKIKLSFYLPAGVSAQGYCGLAGWNADGTYNQARYNAGSTPEEVGAGIFGPGWHNVELTYVADELISAGMAEFAPFIYIASSAGGLGVDYMFAADHTQAAAAGAAANAAATYASSAAASQSGAASQAAAAQTSATNAETAAAGAGTSASQAAQSETNAAGSASAAATSASTAASARDAAQGHASAASTSATNAAASATNAGQQAVAAQTSATNAATAAGEASTSATAAAGSATTAAGSASNAATSATNAATSVSDAAGAASAASTSASAASTSASNAAGSASAAATSASAAQTARTAAETAQGLASTSASNAATSATNAAGSASSAATSATTAATARDSAQAVANRLVPDRVAVAEDFLLAPQYGTFLPASAASLPWGTVVTDPIEGQVREFAATGLFFGTRGWLPIGNGRTFKFAFRAKGVAQAVTLDPRIYLYDAAGSNPGGAEAGLRELNPADFVAANGAWTEQVYTCTSEDLRAIWPSAAYVRGCLYIPATSGAPTVRIARLASWDATSEAAAAGSASAAASSASAASASQAAAANSASSAQSSATSAATSAGLASTSASDAATSASSASTSASNAAGSASTASTQATNAANSAGAASGSAGAAASSASSAATSATNAGNSATAAAASQLAAQSVANKLIPDRMARREDFTGAGQINPAWPDTISSLINQGAIVSVAGEGDVYQNVPVAVLSTRGWLALSGMTSVKAYARLRHLAGGSAFNVGWLVYNSSGEYVANFDPNAGRSATGSFQTYSWAATVADVIAAVPSGVYVRPYIYEFGSGVAFQVSTYGMYDATSEAAAAGSASAAATSASAASTSAGNASLSATSASTSANNASTSAGNATSSASAAATSASAASASASAAQSSAMLSASLAQASLNANPLFASYPSVGLPDGWSGFGSTAELARSNPGMMGSPYSALWVATTATDAGLSQYAVPCTKGYAVLEAIVEWTGGASLSGAGLQINSAGGSYYLPFATTKASTGAVPASFGRYVFSKLIQIADTGPGNSVELYAMQNYGTLGANTPKVLRWFKAGLRPADEQEIAAGVAIPSLQAAVATNASAIATVDGRTQAHWALSGNAGNASFAIEARAISTPGGASQSAVGIVADEFSVKNSQSRKSVLRIAGQEVLIDGNLTATSGIFLGSGVKWQVALRQKTYSLTDGQAVSFAPLDLGNYVVEFAGDGLAPLAAGETYKFYADAKTGTGFTPRLKIVTPGASSSVNISGSSASGSGPARQLERGSNNEATNGAYTLAIGGTYSGYAYNYNQ